MSIRQELVCRWVRPYIVRELPGWGKVYALLIGGWKRDAQWAGAKLRTIRGKLHGYEMTLDISRWSERYTYFLGRFYDLETQLLMKRFLRPGDRVADVGANVGMITLLAARLVGPEGVVEAFEPNPVCQRKVEHALVRNRIGHVRLHGVGLGAETSHARLSVKSINSGEGTLTPVDDRSGFDTIHDVRVVRGDSILAIDARAIALIKIDVEGFECHALRGLRTTLEHHRPLVSTEIVEAHLRRAGKNSADVFRTMHDSGYTAYAMGLRRGLFGHTLDLQPCTAPVPGRPNVLWIPLDGPFASRARALRLVPAIRQLKAPVAPIPATATRAARG